MTTGMDSVDIYLEGMGDSAYSFTVRSSDKYGNHSLELPGFAVSYSETFVNAIAENARNLSEVAFTGDAMAINWQSPYDRTIWSEVEYQTKSNETKSMKVLSTAISLSCPDAKQQPGFRYRTVFQLEPTAIDSIFSEWRTWTFPKTSLWLTGSATTAGSAGDKIELPYAHSHPWVYIITTFLKEGNLKFLAAKNGFSGLVFRPETTDASITNSELLLYRGGVDRNWQIKASEAGNYRITLDLNIMTIRFDKLN
jgi:hypothetical protein